jgi:tetratricopeptide (TPR) repeat protein
MLLSRLLLSKKVLFVFLIVVIFSLFLTRFSLIGVLGFEFSAVVSVVLSFASALISSDFVNLDLEKRFVTRRRFSDLIAFIFFVNLFMAFFPFLIGFLSSLISKDCYIKEGVLFYLLIPVVTVFFSTSIGLVAGAFFPKRGFLISTVVITALILASLRCLYSGPSFFSYNPIFGFFPGPIYDEAIPITHTLVVYRITVLLWGVLLLSVLRVVRGFRYGMLSFFDIIALVVLAFGLYISHLKKEELGIAYTRSYITGNVLTGSIETKHFIIYYAPGTSDAKRIELIADDHEWRYHQLQEFLGVGFKGKIRSYIYPSVDIRKKMVGAGNTTVSNPIHKEIHLVYSSFPHPLLKHELAHVMASEFGIKGLGISPKVGLIEGLAVAADWSSDLFTPHQWSKVLIQGEDDASIRRMLGVGFWYAPPRKSYTLMGSFCRYLIDTYGIERFKELYRTGRFNVYEKSLEELISEWRRFLEHIEVPSEIWPLAEYKFGGLSLFQRDRCPRKVSSLKEEGIKAFKDGDLYRAKVAFQNVLSLEEGDPETVINLAYVYYFSGDYMEVVRFVKRRAGSLKEVERNILENIRGNALWQMGRGKEARVVFEYLLQRTIPPEIKREIEIKLSAMSLGGDIEDRIRQYFGTREKIIQFASLEEVIRYFPDYAPAYHLLGKRFFNEGYYKRASLTLLDSESIGLPSKDLEIENLRILGVSLFAVGDYNGAIKRFEQILDMGTEPSLKDYALDFIERCIWVRDRELK